MPRQLSDYFRESLSFTIMLKEDAREADIRMLQKELDAKAYVKQTEYVSKDEAAVKLQRGAWRGFSGFSGV
ncbi:MAG: permease-like cell division protein FtsX [Marinilabiliales bacterium]|nr:permease-like cell division protein FtsX [Marinilabiliales bacterium]